MSVLREEHIVLFRVEVDLCVIEVLLEEGRDALVAPLVVDEKRLALDRAGAGQPEVAKLHLAIGPLDVPVGLVRDATANRRLVISLREESLLAHGKRCVVEPDLDRRLSVRLREGRPVGRQCEWPPEFVVFESDADHCRRLEVDDSARAEQSATCLGGSADGILCSSQVERVGSSAGKPVLFDGIVERGLPVGLRGAGDQE